MPKRPSDPIRQTMAEKTAEGAGPKRLYAWLRTRYDELAAAKAELGPTWQQFTDTVIAQGARMGRDRIPSVDAVRKAFLRVEHDLEAEKKSRPVRRQPPPPVARGTPQPVSPEADPSSLPSGEEAERARLRAQFSRAQPVTIPPKKT
jgi:hypothetical protein